MKTLSGILRFFPARSGVAISISFLVTVLALWLAMRGVDFRTARNAVSSMRLLPLVWCLVFLVAGTLVRAWRWHLLMKTHGSTFGAALEAVLVSVFFTGVLPLRTGEIVRIGYFARRTGAPVVSTTAALVLERTLDVTMLALFGAVFLSGFAGHRIPGLRVPPWALGAGAGAAAAGMLAFGFWASRRAKKRSGEEPRARARFARWFDEGLRGLAALGSARTAAAVFGLSFLMWFITMLPGQYVFSAVGRSVPYADIVVIMLGTAFAVAMPSSPGFIGTFHAGFVLSAGLVGIDKSVALPVAVVAHLLSQIPFILAGGFVLATGGRMALAKNPKKPD